MGIWTTHGKVRPAIPKEGGAVTKQTAAPVAPSPRPLDRLIGRNTPRGALSGRGGSRTRLGRLIQRCRGSPRLSPRAEADMTKDDISVHDDSYEATEPTERGERKGRRRRIKIQFGPRVWAVIGAGAVLFLAFKGWALIKAMLMFRDGIPPGWGIWA
jgi:hypothetical protein